MKTVVIAMCAFFFIAAATTSAWSVFSQSAQQQPTTLAIGNSEDCCEQLNRRIDRLESDIVKLTNDIKALKATSAVEETSRPATTREISEERWELSNDSFRIGGSRNTEGTKKSFAVPGKYEGFTIRRIVVAANDQIGDSGDATLRVSIVNDKGIEVFKSDEFPCHSKGKTTTDMEFVVDRKVMGGWTLLFKAGSTNSSHGDKGDEIDLEKVTVYLESSK